MKRVHCNRCAFIFFVGSQPNCTATAEFKDGFLRKKIDVRGMHLCITRNLGNDCGYFRRISYKGFTIKRWLKWRIADATPEKKYRGYTINKEVEQISGRLIKKDRESNSSGREKATRKKKTPSKAE